MKLLTSLIALAAGANAAKNLVETAQGIDDFSTLVAAVGAADLVDALSGEGPFTVFAPVNSAFDPLDLDYYLAPENKDELVSILTYHVLGAKVMSTDLSDGQMAETLQGESVTVSLKDGVMVNDATVTTADVEATNGVIHVIDKVLVPPGISPRLKPTMDIVDIAAGNEDFSTLVAAVQAAGLVDALKAEDSLKTVFAPVNSAFEPLDLDYYLAPENKDELTSILTYHVLGSKVLSTDLSDGLTATTLQGEDVTITLPPPKVNDAMITTADVMATNGVIHVIDAVLVPPGLTPKLKPTKDIVEIAQANEDFSTLVAAVVAADLVDALKAMDPMKTVFAPTNAAFEALPEGTVETLLKPENKQQLTDILLYHVLGAKVLSTDLTDGLKATTLQGGKVTAHLDPVMINDANVILADVMATNGVIHAIDKVLIPCADSMSWTKKGDASKDCAWVAKHTPRCNVKGEDNVRAWYGCPGACGTTCSDDGTWYKRGDTSKDCSWVAAHPSEVRCNAKGADDAKTLAKDACPSACAGMAK
eukprot:CAMPEP_0119269340 /NCGR_PEP_ID=MMETSP1329-20130426/6781_1 /TAXON_ID=114041 /ORGANISM="Genus nov. species nov., Strain RCC1024" /LENGTH=532 /DNA_ID=CAMNT_0007269339 /DNA_START=181 /DNA_END=1779 /DNA_ORIENTATION=+